MCANSIMYADLSLLSMAINRNNDLIRSKSQVSWKHWGEEFVMCYHLGQQEYKILNRLSYQVCVVKFNASNTYENSIMNEENKLMIQATIERYAFRAFVDVDEQYFIILMFDQIQLDSKQAQLIRKEMIQHIPKKLQSIFNCQGDCKYDVSMGVSTPYRGFRTVEAACEEAKESISFSSINKTTIFYDELPV